MIPVVLTVGALDQTGADGILADIRTFAALGVHGVAAVAALGVPGEALQPDRVAAQMAAVREAMQPAVVKLGALGSPEVVRAVAAALAGWAAPVIADPSLAARNGAAADLALVVAWREAILPTAAVVTPNLAEAALLTGTARATTLGEMQAQGEALLGMGADIAVVSGGHGQSASAVDIVVAPGRPPLDMRAGRLDRSGMSGLSTTFASAIAAYVAHETEPFEAVHYAKLFVSTAVAAAERPGDGNGPPLPHQMVRMWRRLSPPGEA